MHDRAAAPHPVGARPGARSRTGGAGVRWVLPGFAPMTRITTSFGEVHAQALRERDLVRTKSGRFMPIVWLDRIRLDGDFLALHPDAQPIAIREGALGRGLPKNEIMLSPRQVIAAAPGVIAGPDRTAADLLNRPGVFRRPETGLTYTMFHLGEPAVVFCEGVPVHVSP